MAKVQQWRRRLIPRRIFLAFDLITLTLAFFFSHWLLPFTQSLIRQRRMAVAWAETLLGPIVLGPVPRLTELLWVAMAIVPLTIVLLSLLGNHEPLLRQTRTRIILGSLLAPFGGLAVAALLLFALKGPSGSRLFVFSFVLISAAGLALYRMLLRWYVLQRQLAGHYAKRIVLVGPLGAVERMAQHFDKHIPSFDYCIAGYVCVDSNEQAPGSHSRGRTTALSPLWPIGELRETLFSHPIHEMIVIQPKSGGPWIEHLINDCTLLGIALRIVPEPLLPDEGQSLLACYPLQPLNLPAVVLHPPAYVRMDSEAEFVKRLLDVSISAILLVLISPLLLLIAMVLKISEPSQPILYPWRVVGQNGIRFTGYKFRTMAPNADEMKDRLMHQNEMNGPVFKVKNDPRITPVGRILRKFSLDELPQLWSVLKGDMSLVGPRPAGVNELPRYEFWHKRKLSIRSGITCLWQVRGRNRITDFDEWVKLDLEYIDKWSLWLDIKILFMTAWVVVRGTGQ